MACLDNVTVIVAHGAWADGSSSSELIGALAKKGLRAGGRNNRIALLLAYSNLQN